MRHDEALIDSYENRQKIAVSKKVAVDEQNIEENFSHVDSRIVASVERMLSEASDAGELSGSIKNTSDAKNINSGGIDMGAPGRLSINTIITETLDADSLQKGCEMSDLDVYLFFYPDELFKCVNDQWIIDNE